MEEMKKQEVKVGLGVIIIFFNKDFSKILLLKRNKEKRDRFGAHWGNIGGKIEKRELSIDAAMRETREEIGIELKKEDLKLILVKELPNFTANFHGIQFIYTTKIDEKTSLNINDESDEFKWFKLDELPESMFESKEDILSFLEMAKK